MRTCVALQRRLHSSLGVARAAVKGRGVVYLTDGILLLHDMHALAPVHILLQNPHLVGPPLLQITPLSLLHPLSALTLSE